MADLSLKHEPVSDLFQWPRNREQWEQLKLDVDQVEFFHEHGYLAGVRLLNQKQIQSLLEELEEFFTDGHEGSEYWYEYNRNESNDPNTVLFHALGSWRLRPAFHDALWNPRFLMAASQLLGGAVRFWHDQLFCKPARHGGVVAWHQDYSYWTRTKPMNHLTCWIGLDESTTENGCLHYVPGSHRWELLPITGLAGQMDAMEHILSHQQLSKMNDPVPIELAAGECSFHHPLMVHGSFENRTEIPRRALVLNVCRDGVCSDSDKPLLAGVDPVAQGEQLSGRFFPLLFDPDSIQG